MVIAALINFAALMLFRDGVGTAMPADFWFGFSSAAYLIVAIVYLLGLRMWYAPTLIFLLLDSALNFSIVAVPLSLNLFSGVATEAVIVIGRLYLVLMGIMLMRYDRGTKLNDLLKQS